MPLFAALVSASGVAESQVLGFFFVWALLAFLGSVGLGLSRSSLPFDSRSVQAVSFY